MILTHCIAYMYSQKISFSFETSYYQFERYFRFLDILAMLIKVYCLR